MAKRKKRVSDTGPSVCHICGGDWSIELVYDTAAVQTSEDLSNSIRLCPACYAESEILSEAFLNEDGSWRQA